MSISPDTLWRLSATETAAAIQRRDVSCREVTASVLAHIETTNPSYNALTEVLTQEALAAADAADRQLASGQPVGVLHGVPVTTKVNVDQAGCATTNGSLAQRHLVAQSDSPVVANLRRAGAILVGRTNTATYSVRWFTDNAVHGQTINPWSLDTTPGGSSGGAAAAVASGMGAIAHGNDMGGSIRYPAYCCGVVGLRPTIGRIPAFNPSAPSARGISSQQMSAQGPLARSVADVRLAMQAMAQFDPRDANAIDLPWTERPTPAGLRVAVCRSDSGLAMHPAVAQALDDAAQWLQGAGYVVHEVAPPTLTQAADLWRVLTVEDARRNLSAAIADHGDAPMRASQLNMEYGIPHGGRDAYLNALALRFDLARQWAEFLHQYPLLLLPVSCQPPARQNSDTGDYAQFKALLDAQSPLLSTACLGLPGISVPTGMHGAAPMGVQLVSARFRDDWLLDAAAVIESAAGFTTWIDR